MLDILRRISYTGYVENTEFTIKIEGASQKARAYLVSHFKINDNDLDDIIQQSTMNALKNLPAFSGKSHFDTWFLSICKHETSKMLRNNARFSGMENVDFGGHEPEVYKKMHTDDCVKLIHNAMKSLSEKHHAIIKIVLENSSSYKEIADILHIPINSAKTRLFYAKKHLRQLIGDKDYSHK